MKLSCPKVSLFILFIPSWKQRESVYLVSFGLKKNQSFRPFLFWKKRIPQNYLDK